MAIRLQEMHPALVHLPIALLPLAVGADVIGSLTDKKSALSFGQKALCVAAAGAVASADRADRRGGGQRGGSLAGC